MFKYLVLSVFLFVAVPFLVQAQDISVDPDTCNEISAVIGADFVKCLDMPINGMGVQFVTVLRKVDHEKVSISGFYKVEAFGDWTTEVPWTEIIQWSTDDGSNPTYQLDTLNESRVLGYGIPPKNEIECWLRLDEQAPALEKRPYCLSVEGRLSMDVDLLNHGSTFIGKAWEADGEVYFLAWYHRDDGKKFWVLRVVNEKTQFGASILTQGDANTEDLPWMATLSNPPMGLNFAMDPEKGLEVSPYWVKEDGKVYYKCSSWPNSSDPERVICSYVGR